MYVYSILTSDLILQCYHRPLTLLAQQPWSFSNWKRLVHAVLLLVTSGGNRGKLLWPTLEKTCLATLVLFSNQLYEVCRFTVEGRSHDVRKFITCCNLSPTRRLSPWLAFVPLFQQCYSLTKKDLCNHPWLGSPNMLWIALSLRSAQITPNRFFTLCRWMRQTYDVISVLYESRSSKS